MMNTTRAISFPATSALLDGQYNGLGTVQVVVRHRQVVLQEAQAIHIYLHLVHWHLASEFGTNGLLEGGNGIIGVQLK